MVQSVKTKQNKTKPGYHAGDSLSIHESGRFPGEGGEGNSNSLQYSCLGNPMDRGAWQAIVHGVAKELDTIEHTPLFCCFQVLAA